ncbi:MAG TPA: PBP1A family penicillin-binding protein [Syntrophomonadaceae bacterium]|nr:PBP1A family penicillin-binding protein [Syntrophomonadaceae bacterium]
MRKITLVALVLLIFILSAFIIDLPKIDVPEASIVYDINDRPIKGLSEQNRIAINYDEIPVDFINAVIAVEDKDFYKHHGVDITGIIRAMLVNLKNLKVVEGGSTITQQTAKNLFLSNERTFLRKIKELFYAIELERRYSKNEIVTMYCNTIYFSEGAYGIEVASRTFFAKNAIDLTLAQSALLAGLPQWPSNYNPYLKPELAKKRQETVLQRMVIEGVITEEERKEAVAEELTYQRSSFITGEAPYFIALVKDYLSRKYGERTVYQGGLKIYTTLDIDLQRVANESVQKSLNDYDQDLQAALVAVDVTNGHIRSFVGGRNFTTSNYNRIYSLRQPGSTFKPFMYSLAIDSGFTAADKIMCEEVEFKLDNGDVYRPTDYGDEPYHWREFTLKEALMISDNVVAVQINHILGPDATAQYTEQFGFSNLKPVLSLPLGSIEVSPLQMASAYSVFANSGIYSEPIFVLKVVDKNGKVLEENSTKQKQIISPENAYITTNMLEGVLVPGGTGSRLRNIVSGVVAGKTGTTDDFKDAWFVGYSPSISCAVWVGYDSSKSTNKLVGGVVAGPIWARLMQAANEKLEKKDFNKPDNISLINVCLDSGMIATELCPRVVEMAFINGSQPQDICYHHRPTKDWFWDIIERPFLNGLER